MEGYVVRRWGSAPEWSELADPEVGPGEVLVQVEACSVGLTVLNCINGDLANDEALLPRIPGHEFVGTVADVGDGADRSLIGRRVAAYFYLTCGSCPTCVAGLDPRCERLAGWVGVHRDGGYAPLATLPAGNAIPLPDELDPISATVVADAVATPVHVAARADITSDDRVVVIGAGGGVGIHMVQVAAHRGAIVAGFDIVDDKLALIEAHGAIPVNSGDLDGLAPDRVFPGGRPTVVIDLIGTTATARWAVDGLAMGGRLLQLTTFRQRPVSIESREMVFRELSILGSRYANRAQLTEAAELVRSGAIKPVIGAVGGPQDIPAMHDQLRAGTLAGRGALDWSRS